MWEVGLGSGELDVKREVKAVRTAGMAGANSATIDDARVHTDCQPCANMRWISVIVDSPGFTTIV